MKICLLFLLLITGTCFGQEIEELSKKFDQTKQARLKMTYASDLAWKWRDVNPDSSLRYAEVALELSQKLGNIRTEYYSLSDIGSYYKHKEDYEKAFRYFQKSLQLRKTTADKGDIASGYNQLGLLFRQQEKHTLAATYFQQGIKVLPSNDESDIKSSLMDGYGMTLLRIGDFEKALYYIRQSMKIAEKSGDSLSIAKSHQNLGAIYEKQGAARLALTEFKIAEQFFVKLGDQNGILESIINQALIHQLLGEITAAEKKYKSAERLSRETGFLDNLPTIWFNQAELYLESNPNRSIAYYKQALKNAVSSDKQLLKTECLLGLMDASIRMGKLGDAAQWKFQLESNFPPKNLAIRKDFLDLCVEYTRKAGDYESAFKYSQDLLRIRDSLDNLTLNNLEALSQLEKARNEEKIAKEKLNRIKAEENKTQMSLITLSIAAVLLAVLGVTTSLVYRSRLDKNRAAIREQQLQQEMTDLLHESDIRVMEESLTVESKTRKSIGKDLHDNLGSKLAVVQIMLDSFRKRTQSSEHDVQEKLLKAIQLIDDSCKDLRTISRNLVNVGINEVGLMDSIEILCKTITENTPLEITFHSEKETILSDTTCRKNILAVISLLVNNILRHSGASQAEIIVRNDDKTLSIVVSDNGKGFDSSQLNRAEGIGLKNARERLEMMQGTIELTSEKGKGTNIFIQIPII